MFAVLEVLFATLHIAEDGGLDVVALVAMPAPAGLQLGPLLLPAANQLHNLVKLLLGHLHKVHYSLML